MYEKILFPEAFNYGFIWKADGFQRWKFFIYVFFQGM